MISSFLESKMKKWRQTLHQIPEFGFDTVETTSFIVEKLREFGINEIDTQVGGAGVVATLRNGDSKKSIALRADIDALMINEKNDFTYKSKRKGFMHACGHDGHTATLLGAAEFLNIERGFNGTIRLLFQPAEEWGQGAQSMIDDGLMVKFPFQEIWGFHNMPGIPLGHFETCEGPFMAAEDNFEIKLKGLGGHSSSPHKCKETLVPACNLVMELQTIVSRKINPNETAVVSVTEFKSDGIRNALPGISVISGDVRCFNRKISEQIKLEMSKLVRSIGLAHDLEVEFKYTNEFVPLINDQKLTKKSLEIASIVFGKSKTNRSNGPITGSEDFARYLEKVPGSFAFIGNGRSSEPLHNPFYNFNDTILKCGAEYLIAVARSRLPV